MKREKKKILKKVVPNNGSNIIVFSFLLIKISEGCGNIVAASHEASLSIQVLLIHETSIVMINTNTTLSILLEMNVKEPSHKGKVIS